VDNGHNECHAFSLPQWKIWSNSGDQFAKFHSFFHNKIIEILLLTVASSVIWAVCSAFYILKADLIRLWNCLYKLFFTVQRLNIMTWQQIMKNNHTLHMS